MSGDVFVCACKPDDAEPGCAYCMGTHYVPATLHAELLDRVDTLELEALGAGIKIDDLERFLVEAQAERDALHAKLDAVTKDAIEKLQQAADSLRPPERLTELRAEYWKAGAVAAIEAMNAALTGVAIGESHE